MHSREGRALTRAVEEHLLAQKMAIGVGMLDTVVEQFNAERRGSVDAEDVAMLCAATTVYAVQIGAPTALIAAYLQAIPEGQRGMIARALLIGDRIFRENPGLGMPGTLAALRVAIFRELFGIGPEQDGS